MEIKTVLVATDGSEHANKALDLASDVAAKYGARMVLLHVLMRDATVAEVRELIDVSELSEELQAEIERLEAIPFETSSISGAYANVPITLTREVLDAVGSRITEAARKTAADRGIEQISTVMAAGDPARRILETASAEQADMIVMGSRGFGDLRGLLLGSVSHKVCHLAECTCVTVK